MSASDGAKPRDVAVTKDLVRRGSGQTSMPSSLCDVTTPDGIAMNRWGATGVLSGRHQGEARWWNGRIRGNELGISPGRPEMPLALVGNNTMTPPIYHVRHGSGSELLLLHGLGGSSGSWAPISEALATQRTLIAVDLPGFGRSPPLPGQVSLEGLADAMTVFLASHGLTGVNAVGSSMGAQLVLELSKRQVVGRVVSLNPGGFWSATEQRFFFLSIATSMGIARRLKKFLPGLIGNPVTRTLFLAQFSPRPWRLPPEMVLDEIRRYLAAPSFNAMLRVLAHAPPQQGGPSGVRNSIVIGWGRSDRICFPRQAQRALEQFPDARIHWFEKCGHFPHWDVPSEAVKLILVATN